MFLNHLKEPAHGSQFHNQTTVLQSLNGLKGKSLPFDWQFWTSLRTFSPISVSSEQLNWKALTQMNLSWSSVFAIMHNLQSLPQPSLLLNGNRTVWENCPCSSHFVWLWSHSTSCLCYSKLLCVWLDWRRRSLYLPSAPHVQLHYNSFSVDSRTQSICC